jgi:AraC-like DNA-binding protein
MELLSEFDAADSIARLLRLVRVRSTVYCRSLMSAPWGFGVEPHGNPSFHVVTSGNCWLAVDGDPEQTLLVSGDLVVLPGGCRHLMRDHPSTPAIGLEEILAAAPLDDHHRLSYGGGGRKTELLCGGFALDSGPAHPMMRALPTTLMIRGNNGQPVPWLAATIAMLSAESASDAPGAEEVVRALGDALLTQALRAALVGPDGSGRAGVLALGDPQITAAIALIHDQPERAWTIGGLAKEVALSRSSFAARFRQLVGESPLRYITRIRLARAAERLHTTEDTIAQIAAHTGYRSEFAFSKAFKRAFGMPPVAYRGRRDTLPIELAREPQREA